MIEDKLKKLTDKYFDKINIKKTSYIPNKLDLELDLANIELTIPEELVEKYLNLTNRKRRHLLGEVMVHELGLLKRLKGCGKRVEKEESQFWGVLGYLGDSARYINAKLTKSRKSGDYRLKIIQKRD